MIKWRYRSILETNAPIVGAILIFMLQSTVIGETCKDILCSHVFDQVCGLAESPSGVKVLMKFQNICYLEKMKCNFNFILDVHQVPDRLCNIDPHVHNVRSGRRITDFNLMGSYQTCNHTCPIHCTDIYHPACAQIWSPGHKSAEYRTMVNHCHIDLLSCAFGLNVTILPQANCYKNSGHLIFMGLIANSKSLKLLDNKPVKNSGKFFG